VEAEGVRCERVARQRLHHAPVMTSNPKRPKRSPADDTDEEVLRADDPRPQRVGQYPTWGWRLARRGRTDQALRAEYDLRGAEPNPAFLYVERGPGTGQLLEVRQGALIIGRAPGCDLRLSHPSISRRHARLRRIGERLSIEDLGSYNGTFVKGARIRGEVELEAGQSVSVGAALMRLRGAPGIGSSPPPPGPEGLARVTRARLADAARRRLGAGGLALALALATGALAWWLLRG
jgi:FHA domain